MTLNYDSDYNPCHCPLLIFAIVMDGRNNQFNPQNARNRQVSNTLSAELNHILQHGVTPEQFAENARQLESYGRINAAAFQVYLQRQSQQAEQRRQDE